MGFVETKEVADTAAYSSGSDTHSDHGKGASPDGRTASVVVQPGELEELSESTQRGLKSRHAQMIALGGTIGTGLFVGSGATLARGGPLFILICYSILAMLVMFVVTAITEIAAHLPVPGGTMSYYGFRYVSSSLGFAMGWLYWYVLLPQLLLWSRLPVLRIWLCESLGSGGQSQAW